MNEVATSSEQRSLDQPRSVLSQIARATGATISAVVGAATGLIVATALWNKDPATRSRLGALLVFGVFGGFVWAIFAINLPIRRSADTPNRYPSLLLAVGTAVSTVVAIFLPFVFPSGICDGMGCPLGFEISGFLGVGIFVATCVLTIAIGQNRKVRRWPSVEDRLRATRISRRIVGAACVLIGLIALMAPWRWEVQDWGVDAYSVAATGNCGYFVISTGPKKIEDCGPTAQAAMEAGTETSQRYAWANRRLFPRFRVDYRRMALDIVLIGFTSILAILLFTKNLPDATTDDSGTDTR